MKNGVLLLLVILLAVIPVIFQSDAEFSGADEQAEQAIMEVASNYEPWFDAIWEPPSGEIESLLFSLQAAIGAIIIGYIFGYGKAKKKYTSSNQ
ncbi:cobalt ABC transporter substrate-binding protein CbiN [Desulfuribacillus stibiiarsenatis]|uniref:Cobalt transport protein CbiN n=1 Tax=Desulfuribacillus stibiiarsenatis TaxID=1390249 RepID=A0A1E5L4Z3_9FIRM|nr:energy-coupling factor ABC transporter substrate-binding protein [Desulfuribacillus stibiiarsenatis]OEH85083.1 cobalt ABC transporter substrate-binding protein CbiN [Desulfuribacillus stibiiarsenatis]